MKRHYARQVRVIKSYEQEKQDSLGIRVEQLEESECCPTPQT